MSFSIKDAHDYLDSLLVFGVKLGLQNMEAVCELLGNPQDDLEFVHVAGTNGKGSTCAMIAAALKNCSVNTGFYSSPFLCNFNERWRINGLEVEDDAVSQAIQKIALLEPELISKTGVRPTYFEVLTAAALLIFKDTGVDMVVWETGLGGRLDATNVVNPVLSVITNIELDHTQYLGDTLLDIAYEKGGIIKPGVPFVCGDQKSEIVDYYQKLSKERNSPAVFTVNNSVFGGELDLSDGIKRKIFYRSPERQIEFTISDPGYYQVQNAGTATVALEKLAELKGYDFELLIQGMGAFKWPGRLEVRDDGMILDGAHNPVGAAAAVESLKEIRPNGKWDFICGILHDKEWRQVLDIFSEIAESFYFVTIQNERTNEAAALKEYAESMGLKVKGSGSAAESLAQIKRPSQTVAVGSLYLIGELLAILNEGEQLRIDSLT